MIITKWGYRLLLLTALAGGIFAEEGDAEAAREALAQSEEDVTAETNLEEVFQAAEKRYSLLKQGEHSATFAFGYSYYRDDRIDIAVDSSGKLSRFRIENDSAHSFTSSVGYNYGLRNNLTLNANMPLVFKLDTQKESNAASLGDLSFGLRWQPFPVKPGTLNSTIYTSMSLPTGESPYEINVNNETSSGAGFVSMNGGASVSKVLDPVVLFASAGYTMNFDATGLNQQRGSRVLEEVQPGDSMNFSMGLAYALSYDVSLSASYGQGYSFPTRFLFRNGDMVESEDSVSASVNMALGLRTTKNQIYNVSFGFGLTEDSPDVTLGFSMPLEFAGLKK